MPDVKTQISAMVEAYREYVRGKATSQGISDNRKAVKSNEAKRDKNRQT